MEIFILFFLIFLNGFFALSEISIISSKKIKLQQAIENGSKTASLALELNNQPSKFLSTVQVGITIISILNGVIGEEIFAKPIEELLTTYIIGHDVLCHNLSVAISVFIITCATVVLGELVPKRLALQNPEQFAKIVSYPMDILSKFSKPLVILLSSSSEAVIRILGIKPNAEPPVTNEEIKDLMEQGAEAGVFHESEQAIVSNVLRLDEQKVTTIMSHKKDISFININSSKEEIDEAIINSSHSKLIIVNENFNDVNGFICVKELFRKILNKDNYDLKKSIKHIIYVPETITTTHLLENFKKNKTEIALVVDEYGEVQGLVTITDVLTSVLGEINTDLNDEDDDIVKRTDGSWLVNGMTSLEKFMSNFENFQINEAEQPYETIGGFIMYHLGEIPKVADIYNHESFKFEVVDMDKNRVDKVLVTEIIAHEENNNTSN